MPFQHEYREYPIEFDEGSDLWRCDTLALENAKLSGLKRQIDDASKKGRRVSLRALLTNRDRRDDAKITEVQITMLCPPERDRWGRERTLAVRKCWAMLDGKRTKLRIEQLYPVSARADLETWKRLDDDMRKLTTLRDEHLKAIVPFDADTLALAAAEAKAEAADA